MAPRWPNRGRRRCQSRRPFLFVPLSLSLSLSPCLPPSAPHTPPVRARGAGGETVINSERGDWRRRRGATRHPRPLPAASRAPGRGRAEDPSKPGRRSRRRAAQVPAPGAARGWFGGAVCGPKGGRGQRRRCAAASRGGSGGPAPGSALGLAAPGSRRAAGGTGGGVHARARAPGPPGVGRGETARARRWAPGAPPGRAPSRGAPRAHVAWSPSSTICPCDVWFFKSDLTARCLSFPL